jgi:DNA-binding MarR family transcriptional regulator
VRLTAKGRRVAAEYRRAVQGLELRARRDLGDRRYDALREGLELLVPTEEDDVA